VPFEQLGRYRLLRHIGEGGMGSVWEAVHIDLEQHVALKLIRADRQKPAQVERFRREMKAIGSIIHPNVVRATDAGEEQGQLFLVMELLDGATFHHLVARHGPLRTEEACELIRQAALGLSAVAAKGRVHRDIKPRNLLLTHDLHQPEGIIKILDLGLALLKDDESSESGLTSSARSITCPPSKAGARMKLTSARTFTAWAAPSTCF
jgi:serine/threonine protein kinase